MLVSIKDSHGNVIGYDDVPEPAAAMLLPPAPPVEADPDHGEDGAIVHYDTGDKVRLRPCVTEDMLTSIHLCLSNFGVDTAEQARAVVLEVVNGHPLSEYEDRHGITPRVKTPTRKVFIPQKWLMPAVSIGERLRFRDWVTPEMRRTWCLHDTPDECTLTRHEDHSSFSVTFEDDGCSDWHVPAHWMEPVPDQWTPVEGDYEGDDFSSCKSHVIRAAYTGQGYLAVGVGWKDSFTHYRRACPGDVRLPVR